MGVYWRSAHLVAAVSTMGVRQWRPTSLVTMIVIHEDILNKVLVVHFLLFFANLFWVFFFSFYFGMKFNPNFKSSLRIPTSGWFSRQPRAVQAAPVYQDDSGVPQRRGIQGWFGGDRG